MKQVVLVLFFVGQLVFGQVTLIVQVPESTPEADEIYIAGDFQGWNPQKEAFRLKRSTTQRLFSIRLDLDVAQIEFKFTRGSWRKVEVQADGSGLPNRKLKLSESDTLFLSIAAWEDQFAPPPQKPRKSTASPNVQVLTDSFYMPQLDRYRRVWVYLPPGYSRTKKSYPVLYILDGQNVFDSATSYSGEWMVDESMDKLAKSGKSTAIVVGIDNGSEYRTDEYTPWPTEKYGGGQGKQTLDFLIKELKPFVDAHYRTKKSPRHTGIMGSSLGGLMATYAGLIHPEVFGKIASFSPAYWINPEIFELAERANERKKQLCYQVMAIPEGKENIDNMMKMGSILENKGFYTKTLSREEGAHNEAFWAREFEAAFLFLFGK